MERGENSDSIPIDLISEILSRLPAKSIARFRCVSKLWGSILHLPYFTDLFLTMSRARPRILLAIKPVGNDPWKFYLLPQPQVPYEKSSSHVVPADFHMKLLGQQFIIDNNLFCCKRPRGYASGLICFSGLSNEKSEKLVICNLSTRQYVMLPKLKNYNDFLGFDPIDKQFKVLSMAYDGRNNHAPQILTLGNGEMSWRKIKCPLAYKAWCEGICINGFLYYLVSKNDVTMEIVCFHVRSEEFKFITPRRCLQAYTAELITYKGKLGVFSWKQNDDIELWVLEDMEKHEWPEYVYTLPKIKETDCSVFVAGVTPNGVIVLSMCYTYKPFYVFYFNPERNTLQTVEIPGNFQNIYDEKSVYIFIDHVEDLKFDITNAKSMSTSTSSKEDRHQKQDLRTFDSNNKAPISISPPEQKRRPKSISTSSKNYHHQKQDRCTFESTNKFSALCLLDDDV